MATATRQRRDPLPLPLDDVLLTLWTADPALAARADAAGVDRIGVDLERIGKRARQRGLATWVSPHRAEHLARLPLRRARRFARVDPARPDVERLLELGAEVLMLPMVASAREADAFVTAVADRATVVLLVERTEAVSAIRELVRVPGVAEIHVGLNDMAISLGLRSRWQVLASDVPSRIGADVREAGLRFGLAGIGRAGDAGLPIPSDLVYAELARTGATATLLARRFDSGADLRGEVRQARARLAWWRTADAGTVAAAHAELQRRAIHAPF